MLKLRQFLHSFIMLIFTKLVHKEKTTHFKNRMCSNFEAFLTIKELELVQE